jgi:hypothetical protein
MILFVFSDKVLTDDYHGVCIGINKYKTWCNNLFFAVADAQEMVATLENELYWERDNILLLTDEAATKQDILNAISAIPIENNSITALIHFSGHGTKQGLFTSNEEYISPVELNAAIAGNSFNRFACILDACHSGIFTENINRGIIASACHADSFSYECDKLGNGVFTNFILNGLSHFDTAEEVFNYADNKTTEYIDSLLQNMSIPPPTEDEPHPSLAYWQHPQIRDSYPGHLNLKVLTVKISGPASLEFNQAGTWEATLSIPSDSVQYQWWIKLDGSDDWLPLGSFPIQDLQMDTIGFTLRLNVIDGNESLEDTLYVKLLPDPVAIDFGKHWGIAPEKLKLFQNFPNPFNCSTNIQFIIPHRGSANLSIYDINGRLVTNLLNGEVAPGNYSIRFAAQTISSGPYLCQLKFNNQVYRSRMMLIK